MKVSTKYNVALSVLSVALLTACDNERPEPIAGSATNSDTIESGDTSQSRLISAQALMETATATVEDRIIEVEDIEVDSVIPPEYLNTEENGGSVPQMALTTLEPTEGNDVKGVVVFINNEKTVEDELGEEQMVSSMRIVAEINGLSPGPHGFHVHEVGDCSAPDASTAGGHLNPEDVAHGGPEDEERHAGDLGNITASAYGVSRLDISDPYLTFDGANTVVGRAVIVHEGQDDLNSQPSGDAGDRVACGVVESYRPDARDVSRTD